MALSIEERVDPKHGVLIVVDMQNDFCHRDGDMAFVENMIPRFVPSRPKLTATAVVGSLRRTTPVGRAFGFCSRGCATISHRLSRCALALGGTTSHASRSANSTI